MRHRYLKNVVGHVVLDGPQQLVEHPRCLDLVLHQGIALAVGTQADAVAQVIQHRQVSHPVLIDDLEFGPELSHQKGQLDLTEGHDLRARPEGGPGACCR